MSSPGDPRLVAGSIGPGTKFASLGNIRYAELRDLYHEQALGLIEGGIDVFVIETQFDLLGAKAAMNGCRAAMRELGQAMPLQVQVTMELTGRMLPGTEIGAALSALDAMRPDVIGLNCATGPSEMHEHLRYLSQHARMPISCLPNAGLPSVVDGQMHYDLTAEQFVEYQTRFVSELGIGVVGGCCGTTPEFIRQLAEAVADVEPAPAPAHPRGRRHVDLQPRPVRAGHLVPDHRRAHQRQRFEEVPRCPARGRLGRHGPDGQGPGARGLRTSWTCASTTSAATAPPTWTRSPAASAPSPACRWSWTPPNPR